MLRQISINTIFLIVVILYISDVGCSICIPSEEFMVSLFCNNYYHNRLVILPSNLWPVIGIITFNIDQAIKQTLFLPEICREALTPFICVSGYNECFNETDVPRPPCRSVCENVHQKCERYFEENNIELPDCLAINNETGLEIYPEKGINFTNAELFVPCFEVDLSVEAPKFTYDCPYPFVTTNDGCLFRCPAPITDDRESQKFFENFYLWSRRLPYLIIYVLGLSFLILQIATYETWISTEKMFPFNLHCYILISSVWNLFGMESNSYPICDSETEQADKDDPGCVAQAFFISTFAGIACLYFFMTLKVMIEVGFGGLRKRKLPKWIIFFGVFLGFICEFLPAIVIVSTGSYEVSALACITDYETNLWGLKHFTFWLINGPATIFVFLGFLFSMITVFMVIRTTISSMRQMNQFDLHSIFALFHSPTQNFKQRKRLVIFIIVFGAIITLAQISTLTGVNSKEYGDGAQKWVICVITNFINSKSFATRNLPQPQCEWDPKPNIFLVAYGVFSPTLFEFVYIIILWSALNQSLHDKYGSSISEIVTSTVTSTITSTSKKLSQSFSSQSQSDSN